MTEDRQQLKHGTGEQIERLAHILYSIEILPAGK